MAEAVDYFYTISSPWSYLGHAPFLAMAAKHGIDVVHKPVDLGSVFQMSGGLPLPKRAIQRQHYRLYELQRWRAYRQTELNLHPAHFPTDPTLANKTVIALRDQGLDAGRAALAFMRQVWVHDRDVAEPAVLQAALAEIDIDGAALVAAADSPATNDVYAAVTEEAKRREVFGAPTYIYRDEPFWGQDRLDFVDRALAGETDTVAIS